MMSIFKDMLASDVNNVFFNTDELADIFDIDGKRVPVVQDDDRILEKPDLSQIGLTASEGTVFIKISDLPRQPLANEQIKINGKAWYVHRCVSNKGVYEIRIGKVQQYS